MFNMLLLRYLDPRSKNNVNANFQAALKSAVLAKAAAVYLIALIFSACGGPAHVADENASMPKEFDQVLFTPVLKNA